MLTTHLQARYLAYLDNKLIPATHLSRREQEREIEEFEGAARLYKPLSGILANRFAPAKGMKSISSSCLSPHMTATTSAGLPDAAEAAAVTPPEPVDDRKEAVKQKKFGKLTREDEEWHPDRLLCKRFNIPDPYPRV